MSRYSSNLPRRVGDGRSMKYRPPASASPSTLNPPMLVCASAGGAHTSGSSIAPTIPTTRPAARRLFMGPFLSSEEEAGRVIGAMNVDVTVHTTLRGHKLEVAGWPTGERRRRVPGLGVALLAEPRLRHLEQGLVVRAVRV